MREAVRGDRERAEARRRAEAEGAYVGPKPPTLDLSKPTRDWKLPEKKKEEAPVPEPVPEPEVQELAPVEESVPEPEPEDLVEPPTSGFIARLIGRLRS